MTDSTKNLIIHLPLDDLLEDRLLEDTTGRHHYLDGNPTLIVDDTFGSCLELDPDEDTVRLGWQDWDLTNGFTTAFWIYSLDLNHESKSLILRNGPGVQLSLHKPADAPGLVLHIDSITATPQQITVPITLAEAQWIHIALSVGSDGMATLYVDAHAIVLEQIIAWPTGLQPLVLDEALGLTFSGNYHRDSKWRGREMVARQRQG